MNRGELKTLINQYSHRTTDDAELNDLIERVAIGIARDAQLFEQDSEITFTAASSGNSAPADYLAATSVTIIDNGYRQPLKYYTPDQLDYVFANRTHAPRGYTWRAQKIYIRPFQAVEVTMLYSQRLPLLNTDSATNDVLTKWPNTYVYGSVKEIGARFQDDDLLDKFNGLYTSEVEKLAAFAEDQRHSGYQQIRAV